MNWRWWLALNVGILAFILGVYKFDLLEEILTRDTTYITTTMMVAALITSITTKGKTWTHWHEFVTDLMPRVGLIGTVIGFMISLDASSVALTTTLAGLVLQVWLDVQKRSIRDTEA